MCLTLFRQQLLNSVSTAPDLDNNTKPNAPVPCRQKIFETALQVQRVLPTGVYTVPHPDRADSGNTVFCGSFHRTGGRTARKDRRLNYV